MKILVINAGSSSLKYQLFDMPDERPLCVGLVDRIGLDKSTLTHKVFREREARTHQTASPVTDHKAALLRVTKLLVDGEWGVLSSLQEVKAVGHRVVHGGEAFSSTTEINEVVKSKIRELIALAPLHNPANLLGIEVSQEIFPDARQVAVFDTAFHQTMPPHAYTYAIPRSLYRERRIRVYGFHGISHQYVSHKAIDFLKKPTSKLITVHLGNGCSITAVKDGRSVDHSMGLGPLGGLVMGTRCGDIDPSVIFHLTDERQGYSANEVYEILNRRSGLLGLSGYSDMRDVKRAIESGNKDAALAYQLYAYRVKKYIGAYAAVLDGLDALVFTAGVGENDADMREAICKDLGFMGICIDRGKNRQRVEGVLEIQSAGSRVKVLVVPTNEELEIGQQTYESVTGKT